MGVFLEAFSESLCAELRGRGGPPAFLTSNSFSVMVVRSAAQEGRGNRCKTSIYYTSL